MSAPTSSDTPPISGLHHFKLPCSDLARSLAFYTSILGAEHIKPYDHRDSSGELYAHILRLSPNVPHPGEHKIPITSHPLLLELRLAPPTARALGEEHTNLLTLSCPTSSAIDQWVQFLTERGVENSGKLKGLIGDLVVFDDPDGMRVRVYSTEMPEGGMDPARVDKNARWLD